jgi:hypothetical protein
LAKTGSNFETNRAEYDIDELGESEFTINGIKYRRDDFQVGNLKN